MNNGVIFKIVIFFKNEPKRKKSNGPNDTTYVNQNHCGEYGMVIYYQTLSDSVV